MTFSTANRMEHGRGITALIDTLSHVASKAIHKVIYKTTRNTLLAASLVLTATFSHATIVQFQTNAGNFEVNLYDDATPETVNNFLTYIEAGAYENAVIHRSASNFVIQGGGFQVIDNTLTQVQTPWSPINEPVYANVRGTIAMAKSPGDPNSATSQWFINLIDNSANLDYANKGFTVFGEVINNGMETVADIASLPVVNLAEVLGNAWITTPLIAPLPTEGTIDALDEHFVIVENIVVIDPEVNTAAELSPPLSTYKPKKKKKSGATDIGILCFLFGLAGFRVRRFLS